MDDFRRFFLRGLAVLVPTLLTLSILVWAYVFVNENVGVYITQGMLALAQRVKEAPTAPWVVDEQVDPLAYGVPIDQWDDHGQRLTLEYKAIHSRALNHAEDDVRQKAQYTKNRALWEIAFRKYRLHLLGFLIAIILVYFVGFFLASFVGRVSWRAAERLIGRTPVVRAIYPNVKQVTDFLLSERKVAYAGVVAVQYPRKGIWSVGLLTGDPMERVQKESTEDLVTIFIPSSPTPVTGYVIQVPRTDIIELDVTIEQALRFTVSAGVIKPGASLPGSSESDQGD